MGEGVKSLVTGRQAQNTPSHTHMRTQKMWRNCPDSHGISGIDSLCLTRTKSKAHTKAGLCVCVREGGMAVTGSPKEMVEELMFVCVRETKNKQLHFIMPDI